MSAGLSMRASGYKFSFGDDANVLLHLDFVKVAQH